MTDKMFLIRENNYWVSDEKMMPAVKRYKRLVGKFPTENASIVLYQGEKKELDKVIIDDMGGIKYPLTLSEIIIQ